MSAVQVLSSAELRAKYDQHGMPGLDVSFVDSVAVFNCLFGSDQFEHLIGELWIATMARSGGEVLRVAEMKAIQAERVERLAVLLNALLRRYVEGDEEGFLVRNLSLLSIIGGDSSGPFWDIYCRMQRTANNRFHSAQLFRILKLSLACPYTDAPPRLCRCRSVI